MLLSLYFQIESRQSENILRSTANSNLKNMTPWDKKTICHKIIMILLIAGKNRCDENGRCSHLCLPNLTEFSCACPTGFMLLPDDKTCTESKSFFIMFIVGALEPRAKTGYWILLEIRGYY